MFRCLGGDIRVTGAWLRQSELVGWQLDKRLPVCSIKLLTQKHPIVLGNKLLMCSVVTSDQESSSLEKSLKTRTV